jgi:hypothetical protein
MSRDVCYFLGVPVLKDTREGLVQPHDGTGDIRVWRRKGSVTTVMTPNTLYKDASAFETLDRAERAATIWKNQGWNGAPSSPARIFARCLEEAVDEGAVPHPRVVRPDESVVDPKDVTWLWIEQMIDPRTHVTDPVYHYDINQAFYSACSGGLPIRFVPYRDGDDRWVGKVEINGARRELPEPWKVGETAYLTATDVRYWGVDVDVIHAVTFEDFSVDLSPVYERIGSTWGPWTAKHARQQSWGCFAQSPGSVVQETYDSGDLSTQTELPDRWSCPEWAVIITRRIMRRVHRAASEGDGISLFVDSVLTRRPISGVGREAGKWGREGKYENGVYMYAPGLWDTRPVSTPTPTAQWKKHSGIAITATHHEDLDTEKVPERVKKSQVESLKSDLPF